MKRVHWMMGLILGASLLQSGCASLSKDECRAADWYLIGQRDGANGRAEEYLAEHQTACGKIGIEPDQKAWFEGRERGLERYCTASSGYRVGESGGSYNDVCFAGGELEFRRGFDLGVSMHRLNSRLDEIERLVRETENRLRRADLPKDDSQYLAIEEAEKRRMRLELRDWEFERGYLTRDRDELKWRVREL
jgi:Protein of unknown function (DUF2799)